jgi:bifunctional lysine-specific demethylase and histidyl-hydroxylase NO66
MMEFSEFIAPFDADKFCAEYFGKKPLFIPRGGHPRENILPWKRFNEVLGIYPYWNEDTLKVFYKSRPSPRENYCETNDLAPGAKAPANPDKVKALIGLGASLVANHLQRVCPEVAAAAQMLERKFAARLNANVYCSFKDVQAFQTHFDLHDVFAVQTEGEKTWRIYEGRADTPIRPVPPGKEAEEWLIANRGPLLFEAVMKPGDVIYLPRGQYHDALTGAQASLHVTFGVSPTQGLAVFKLLEVAAGWESEFRAYLPDARNAAELRERLAKLGDRVKTMMTSPAFFNDVMYHQRTLCSIPVDYALPGQKEPSWYAVQRKVHPARRDKGFIVAVDGQEIPLGATYAAVEWLLQQKYFSLEDTFARYPFVERSELMPVLQQLTKFGVIAQTEMQR